MRSPVLTTPGVVDRPLDAPLDGPLVRPVAVDVGALLPCAAAELGGVVVRVEALLGELRRRRAAGAFDYAPAPGSSASDGTAAGAPGRRVRSAPRSLGVAGVAAVGASGPADAAARGAAGGAAARTVPAGGARTGGRGRAGRNS